MTQVFTRAWEWVNEDPRRYNAIALVLAVLGVIGIGALRALITQTMLWIVLIALVIGLVVHLNNEREKLRAKLEQLNAALVPKDSRWDQIKTRKIRYGHVEYPPLLGYSAEDHRPEGIGVRLLEYLLEGGVERYNRRSSWEDMLVGLQDSKYDILATPLFETRERSKLVAFSSPIFFADIGIYAARGRFPGVEPLSLSWKEVMDLLTRNHSSLQVHVISGELSEKMALKHLKLPQEKVILAGVGELRIQNLLTALVTYLSDDERNDIVFAERFIAEMLSTEVREEKVINLLKEGELLYPVGFVMRREDYVLRNYINIRLMELDDTHPPRVHGFIVDELQKQEGFEHVRIDQAKRFFVRKKEW